MYCCHIRWTTHKLDIVGGRVITVADGRWWAVTAVITEPWTFRSLEIQYSLKIDFFETIIDFWKKRNRLKLTSPPQTFPVHIFEFHILLSAFCNSAFYQRPCKETVGVGRGFCLGYAVYWGHFLYCKCGCTVNMHISPDVSWDVLHGCHETPHRLHRCQIYVFPL